MEADEITIDAQDGILLARAAYPCLEDEHAQALMQRVLSAAEQTPVLPVVLDLSQVNSMPSMSIGALVALWKKLKDGKRRFILAAVQPQVRQTLAVCRLDKLFELCDSVEEAKRRLGPKPGESFG